MRKATLAPLVLLVLDVVSSARISSPRDIKTHEPMIQAFGMPKLSSDLTPFGDNPVIERLGDENVKTTRRRFAVGRAPSIQAYGLPKRILESDGHIERVTVDRVSGLDGKIDEVHFRESPGIQAFGVSKKNQETNGVIERVSSDSSDKRENDSTSGKGDEAVIRRARSIDGDVEDDLMDLEPQEAKVFRPLFVYRQQIADRYRLKGRKNPIYGAYQYRNSINGYHKYY